MILSSGQLKRLAHDESVRPADRFIVTPVLDWDAQAKPGNCSLDVRLGQRFRVPRRTKLDSLDHLHENHKKNINKYKDDHFVQLADHFVIHPRQFVLGETLEWIHLPRGYSAYVIGRSSWGRDGLIIATATGVHAGYSGVITLEITNLGEIPIRIYPGMAIAQLFVHEVKHSGGESLTHSAFSGSTGPESGDAVGDDLAILRRIREKNSH